MGYSRFSLLLALRLVVIMGLLTCVGYLIATPGYHAATLLSFIAVVALTWEIFRFVSKTNQELTRFLDAARYADFGQRFDHGTSLIEKTKYLYHFSQAYQYTNPTPDPGRLE